MDEKARESCDEQTTRSSNTLPFVDALLIFDGDCAFCRCSARFLERRVRPSASVVAYQRADLATLALSADECREAVQWVNGSLRRSGARAIAAVLREGGMPWRVLGFVIDVAPVRPLAAFVYRSVARNRSRLVHLCRE